MNALGDRLTIGEVCALLHLKPHVIRYWEQEVDLLSPEKAHSGRRLYTAHDLHILSRLRYLIQERKLTLDGARDRIYRELTGGNAEVNIERKAAIQEVRQTLFHAARVNSSFLSHLPEPGSTVKRLSAITRRYALGLGASSSEERVEASPRVVRLRRQEPLNRREQSFLCGVTVVPAAKNGQQFDFIEQVMTVLARKFPLSSERLWVIVVPRGLAGFTADAVGSVRPDLEPLIIENLPLVPAPENCRDYEQEVVRELDPGGIGAFLLLTESRLAQSITGRGVRILYNIPFAQGSSPDPNTLLVSAYARWRVDCAVLALPDELGRYTMSTNWLCAFESLQGLRSRLPVRLYQRPDLADNHNRIYVPSLEVAWLRFQSMLRRPVILEGLRNDNQ